MNIHCVPNVVRDEMGLLIMDDDGMSVTVHIKLDKARRLRDELTRKLDEVDKAKRAEFARVAAGYQAECKE